MNNYGKFACRGYYNGQFLRSYNEFLYAVNLDYVENKKFIVEPFAIHSNTSSKKKIPDFLVFTDENNFYLVEIKGNSVANIDTIIDYASNNYMLDEIQVKFVNLNRKHFKSKIIEHIGQEKFLILETEFKSQRNKKFYTGFIGEKNPMYGRKGIKNPNFGKKKTLDQVLKTSGKNNGMFNKTHTEEAKINIGLKWKDAAKAKKIVLAGLKTCISKLSDEQKEIYLNYVCMSAHGKVKKPMFINNYISVTELKIKKYFNNSIDEFVEFVKGIVCQK